MLSRLGRNFIACLEFLGQTSVMTGQAAGYILRGAGGYRLAMAQMVAVGVNSLPIALLTISLSGMVFAYYLSEQALRYGQTQFIGMGVAEAIFREIGPVWASIVLAARAGSAMTAELASMTVTEQVDALRALAVDPVRYLVSPRLAATVLMMPVVTLLADYAGILGGLLVASLRGAADVHTYVTSITTLVDWDTPVRGLAKTFVFGLIIAITACHFGLTCQRAAEAVGRAVTHCVVVCIVLIFLSNYFLTRILYPF